MNVLSLFGGCETGAQALKNMGVEVDNYFSSEVDKYAMKVASKNHPNIIHLGDVRGVRAADLPKIDLLIGGSPCQGFSFAGKQLNFNDPRSALFFEYERILNEVRSMNPDVKFLLENVRMAKEHENVISERMGISPLMINSALVSAQNRVRMYWTNIGAKPSGLFGDVVCQIPQPKDRGILLKDILQDDVNEKYFLSEKAVYKLGRSDFFNGVKDTERKSNCLTTMEGAIRNDATYIKIDVNGNPKRNQDKAGCLTAGAHSGGNHSDMDLVVCLNPKTPEGSQTSVGDRIYDDNGKSPALLANMSNQVYAIHQKAHGYNKGGIHYDKCPTLTSNSFQQNNFVNSIRRLTPIECERLQTLPDNYTNGVSDTQRYKMLGNGWTCAVIEYIFSYLFVH